MSFKIIFEDRNRETQREHARSLVKRQKEWQMKYRPHEVQPIGTPVHLAQFPHTCDDCGETYWSRDPYGAHVGCKGHPSRPTGFG